MKIRKVFISYKCSTYQLYVEEQRNAEARYFYKTQHPSTKRFKGSHQAHGKTMDCVEEILKKRSIPYEMHLRGTFSKISKSFDLVISIGGDGTFLQTAHTVNDHLVLGVNSAPQDSVGAHCNATKQNFEEKLDNLLEDKSEIQCLTRLQTSINGKDIPTLALNEVLFSHECPAGTSRYILQVGQKKEDQKSSGIWIATPAGSTAVINAAGGKVLPENSKSFEYVVREPYEAQIKYELKKGVLQPKQKITITSKMIEGFIFVDGMNVTYPLNFGDEVSISRSPHSLKVII